MNIRMLALALGLCAGQASAHLVSGNELMQMLLDPSNPSAYSRGVGYVLGVADGSDSILFCLPEGVGVRPLIETVSRELSQAADVRHLNASMTVTAALAASFPCKKEP
ncbi:hypothetical protein JI739_04835 [Ramlibacter sp. AW1]|uniref:Rap1a immunity protein domain-containing protein n=1 Tax=Ramlibacter aurantiacus TaxID=2801330 RepID=A0A936ZRE9_9BURK|nr:Rap1a/Tai family immunity protein [Ramlibacter aurantiacus]MBL0419670.1 hypothetical protein [Ramlibacter aurantiacus]